MRHDGFVTRHGTPDHVGKSGRNGFVENEVDDLMAWIAEHLVTHLSSHGHRKADMISSPPVTTR